MMKQKDFTAMEVSDVWDVANAEGADATGGKQGYYPEYYGRPWTQLRDEMTARKVKTVSQLPPDRIKVYRRTTRWVPRLADADWALSRGRVEGRFLALVLVQPWLRYFAGLPQRKAKKQGYLAG